MTMKQKSDVGESDSRGEGGIAGAAGEVGQLDEVELEVELDLEAGAIERVAGLDDINEGAGGPRRAFEEEIDRGYVS